MTHEHQPAALVSLEHLRHSVRSFYALDESDVVQLLLDELKLSNDDLDDIESQARILVNTLRNDNDPTLMESFLGEYGLSTREGVGLMCLAEALLRVPDTLTIDELIADKLESSDWAAHLGQSSSPLVNASTWALLLTGRVLDETDSPALSLSSLLKRVGEPVIRTAVAQAMKLLGRQFVLGENIDVAVGEARELEKKGYTYSYDMLGEAAHTYADAERYREAYATAIQRLAKVQGSNIRNKPGISVKLSALHPRYESIKRDWVIDELIPSAQSLARLAASAGIGFNIDAEEADRLDLSLDVVEALMRDPETIQWHGLGIVVQAYSRRALPVIDWLIAAARKHKRQIMIRLVKGAYWDTEIKQAQELGLASFPVFTRKINTDISYMVCAKRLLAARDTVYPQFATHNAHSVCAIQQMAGDDRQSYEFQRLHGMGEALHELARNEYGTQCRVYAPVGPHQDLLAYLVRRLLENGANSSFVNQITDLQISASTVAQCPVREARGNSNHAHPKISHPKDLYRPERANSKGFRINDPASITPLLDKRKHYLTAIWSGSSLTYTDHLGTKPMPVFSPTNSSDQIGTVGEASPEAVDIALLDASRYRNEWSSTEVSFRAEMLIRTAEAYEKNTAELCALLCREAGKTINDAVSEIREAVDFLRYYAARANEYSQAGSMNFKCSAGHGVIVCISPWNFPLAIFTGQIAGALVSGNVVIAKPAEQTPLIAVKAVKLMYEAGVPRAALQLLLGKGSVVGAKLTSSATVDGVCFTGSTATSRLIEQSLASRSLSDINRGSSENPLFIAETGGINAMIVDSSALTEQVVRDCLISAFQSAGQRCSALRMLYVQQEAYERLVDMLTGAMDCLTIGDPWLLSTDVGPVIDQQAYNNISKYIDEQSAQGALIHQTNLPENIRQQATLRQQWIAPTLLKVDGIADIQHEVFGPVLHLATYEAKDLDSVVSDINASGYGLTFGLHTRIDDRVQQVVDSVKAGNIYINRNQIGAVVGTQPFGGEGLSGTGPKAGGPWYIARLMNFSAPKATLPMDDNANGMVMPGPTGESNHWSPIPRTPLLVVAKDKHCSSKLENELKNLGIEAIVIAQGVAKENLLALIEQYGAAGVIAEHASADELLHFRKQMALGDGPLIPLLASSNDIARLLSERHVCIDTTAAGGNASLLGSVD